MLMSLPLGSRFNVMSYSNHFQLMFEDERSVPNTDENISKAIQMAEKFDAMSHGTDILNPLMHIYKMG